MLELPIMTSSTGTDIPGSAPCGCVDVTMLMLGGLGALAEVPGQNEIVQALASLDHDSLQTITKLMAEVARAPGRAGAQLLQLKSSLKDSGNSTLIQIEENLNGPYTQTMKMIKAFDIGIAAFQRAQKTGAGVKGPRGKRGSAGPRGSNGPTHFPLPKFITPTPDTGPQGTSGQWSGSNFTYTPSGGNLPGASLAPGQTPGPGWSPNAGQTLNITPGQGLTYIPPPPGSQQSSSGATQNVQLSPYLQNTGYLPGSGDSYDVVPGGSLTGLLGGLNEPRVYLD